MDNKGIDSSYSYLILSVSVDGLDDGGEVGLVEGGDAVPGAELLPKLVVARHLASGGDRAQVDHWLAVRPGVLPACPGRRVAHLDDVATADAHVKLVRIG